MVRRRWRFVIQDPKLILFSLEIFVAVGADLAIGAGFMCAAVLSKVIRS